MTTTELAPPEDPRDRRLALRATGLLHDHNAAGVLTAADVHVARRLGRLAGEDDEEVLLAAALAVRAVRSGSVSLALDRVAEVAPELPWPDPDRWAATVSASPLAGSALRVEDGLLYLDRYWREESQVVAALEARAAAPPPEPGTRLPQGLEAYFPGDSFTDQRGAAEAACRQWTTVMTGGPGTGKTTTVARLLGVLLSQSDEPLRIALAAPTGKAAARMAQAVREATQQPTFPGARPDDGEQERARVERIRSLEATTLHRLLGSRPDNRTRFRHHRGNRLPHDVVVVDETSMVSLSLMARLLEAVRPDARLVLVGDADQLASVEAGAVLKDLVDGYAAAASTGAGPVTRLTTTRRYGHAIGGLAEAVRTGDADEVLARLGAGDERVRWADADELPGLLGEHVLALAAAAEAGDHAEALLRFDRHRLLCAHREGPYGVGHWNRFVERLLMEGTGRDWLPEWYAGRPLIVSSNDYGLGLFNGDTGVVCADPAGGVTAVLGDGAVPGAVKTLSTARLADVSTAHAMTVHRSQGSQFDEVTVLLPEPESRILTRELFYTAVTRARSAVRVVGSEESVRAAVERQAQRATGLARRLGG
ncbi:exodeoxyribonuclease V subunit alpha [Nocardioides caldifontis]|uniref:exodeoxyribonuclease V subunit alpha n=1 Tax=Nocardioides caldifontis TaxID=2588938 RepID=UPI0011DFB56E|nr:exodeoxyribonuclease V subunit alpha [Nocardioides caldifontis]